MIGSGIFLLPATLANVGSVTLIGWLLSGINARMRWPKLRRQTSPAASGPAW